MKRLLTQNARTNGGFVLDEMKQIVLRNNFVAGVATES